MDVDVVFSCCYWLLLDVIGWFPNNTIHITRSTASSSPPSTMAPMAQQSKQVFPSAFLAESGVRATSKQPLGCFFLFFFRNPKTNWRKDQKLVQEDVENVQRRSPTSSFYLVLWYESSNSTWPQPGPLNDRPISTPTFDGAPGHGIGLGLQEQRHHGTHLLRLCGAKKYDKMTKDDDQNICIQNILTETKKLMNILTKNIDSWQLKKYDCVCIY